MTNSEEWRHFFDAHAPEYNNEPFTRGTAAEVEFLVRALELEPPASIVDLGCGTGRHAVELARRGFRVTGVDISAEMLEQASMAATEASVDLELIRADLTQFNTDRTWDAAYCVCEGGFGLLGSSDDPFEHDLQILRNARAALKPGGRFLLTCLSALRWAREHTTDEVESGGVDTETMSESYTMEAGPEGDKRSFEVRERVFAPTEIGLMLKVAGFKVDHIGGGTAARWSIRPLELDEYEIMAIAHAV